MASERQKARDARARERGYKNAYDERNQRAKRQGYRSYTEQRQARRTGIGLKGEDRPRVSPVSPPRAPPPPPRIFSRRPEPPRDDPKVSPSGGHISKSLNSSFRHTAAVTRSEVLDATEFGIRPGQAGGGRAARKHREVVQNFQGRIKQDVEAVRRTYSGPLGQHYLDAYRKGLGDPSATLDPDALKAYTKIFQNGTRDAERAAIGATRSLKGTLEDMGDLPLRSRRKAARRNSLKSVVFANGHRWDYNTFLEMSTNANVARASNDGFIRGAVKAGVKFFEIIDGDDCGLTGHDAFPKAAGMVVDAETALSYPIAHPNAIMAGTEVAVVGEVNGAYKANWSGPVVKIRTSGGARLTVGPNHPVFTDRGWVSSKLLKEGDHVVRRADHPLGRSRDKNLDEAHLIEDVFQSVLSLGDHTRVVAMPDQFHGDGNFCHGKVDIVWANRHLASGECSTFDQEIEKAVLEIASSNLEKLSGSRPFELGFQRVLVTPASRMGSNSVGGVSILTPDGKSSFLEPGSELSDSILHLDLPAGFPSQVFFDEIVEIRDGDSFVGHAYDLQTSSHCYWASSILVHNCIRQFIARPDVKDDPDRVKNALKKAAKGYAGAVLRESAQATVKNSLVQFLKNNNVQDRVMAWASSRGTQWPFVFKTAARATGHSPAENIRDLNTYVDDYVEGRAVPSRVVGMMGMNETAPAIAVGDEMGQWSDWYDRTVRAKLMGLSTEVDGLIHDPNFRNAAFNQFFDAVGGLPNNPTNFVRWSLPKIKGKTTGFARRPRLTLVGKDSVKASITRTEKGFINHIRMNPNGLVRAGFSQIEGSIIPSLSLIPKGPIRVMTRVNRGVKGNVTSLTTEVRVITPKWAIRALNDTLGLTDNGTVVTELGKIGINFGTSLNLNLRQLGLMKLSDIRKLSLEDWLELRQSTYFNPVSGEIENHPVVKMASLAADVRFNGGSMFDLAHTWRIPWDQARAFWSLANLELTVADNVRKLETILDRRKNNRITDIKEAVHPYTLAESRSRKGGVSLIKSDLEPLSPLPSEVPKLTKPELKGTKVKDLNLGTVGDQDNTGTVLLVPTDWNERMLITRQKPGRFVPETRPVQTLDELWEWLAATRGSYLADRDFEQQKFYIRRFFRRGLWFNMPEGLRQQIKDTYDVDVHVQGNFPGPKEVP